jgi:hypothetical protein
MAVFIYRYYWVTYRHEIFAAVFNNKETNLCFANLPKVLQVIATFHPANFLEVSALKIKRSLN